METVRVSYVNEKEGVAQAESHPRVWVGFLSFAAQVRVLLAALGIRGGCYGTESVLILSRGNKGADHASVVVWLAIVQHVQPEQVAFFIRVAPEVAKVFHRDKGWVVFPLLKLLNFDYLQ